MYEKVRFSGVGIIVKGIVNCFVEYRFFVGIYIDKNC